MEQSLNSVKVHHRKYGIGTIFEHKGNVFQVAFISINKFVKFSLSDLNVELYGFKPEDRTKISVWKSKFIAEQKIMQPQTPKPQPNFVGKEIVVRPQSPKNKINENFSLSTDRINAIKQVLEQRHIKFLVHFTRKENLESIRVNGLLPLDCLIEKDINFIQNDSHRFDGTNAICMTITRPNWQLFRRFQRINNSSAENWVALKLNAEKILTNCKCRFCPVNAATDKGAHILNVPPSDASDLEKLFVRTNYADKCLSDDCTTDPQAEVLVFNNISYSYVEEEIFNPTYEKIVGGNFGEEKPVLGAVPQKKIMYTKIGTYKNIKSYKSTEAYAFFGKIDSDYVLVICKADNIEFMTSWGNKVKEHGGYRGELKLEKGREWQRLQTYRGIVYMDKSIIANGYNQIIINSYKLAVEDVIRRMAPYLI